jgi:hypothetical protein
VPRIASHISDARHTLSLHQKLTALGIPPLASPAELAFEALEPAPVVELLDMVVGVMVLVEDAEVVIIMVVDEDPAAPAIPEEEMLNISDWA